MRPTLLFACRYFYLTFALARTKSSFKASLQYCVRPGFDSYVILSRSRKVQVEKAAHSITPLVSKAEFFEA